MSVRTPLRIVCLGSGSSGNAIAVTDGHTTVLMDCGFSAREVSRRLLSADIDPTSVSAILLTHEHSDHVRGVDVFVRRHAPASCTIYATAGTLSGLVLSDQVHERTVTIRRGEQFAVETLRILPFATSHDAAQPVGYRIDADGCAAGIATDTGVLTAEAAEALSGCALVGIECNHDVEMLANGPYPRFLKRRIGGHAGHLSNVDAADAVEALAHDGLVAVFALHRSRTNNTARLAGRTLQARLGRIGLPVPVTVAAQDELCDSDSPQQGLFS